MEQAKVGTDDEEEDDWEVKVDAWELDEEELEPLGEEDDRLPPLDHDEGEGGLANPGWQCW